MPIFLGSPPWFHSKRLIKPVSSGPISLSLEKYINNFPILVNGSPEIILLTVDFDEDFVDEERVAVSSVPSLRATGINCAELDAPESYGLSGQGLARAERVSNPCHIKRSMRISRTTLTYSLHLKAYETYWLGQLSVCT